MTADPAASDMPASRHAAVVLHGGDPPTGTLITHGVARPFAGWLSLLRLLDEWVADDRE